MADAIEYYDCPLNDDFACACGKIEEIRVAAMNCLVGACKPFEVRSEFHFPFFGTVAEIADADRSPELERQARQYCAGS